MEMMNKNLEMSENIEMNIGPTENELKEIETNLYLNEDDLWDSQEDEDESFEGEGEEDRYESETDDSVNRNSLQQYLADIANIPLLTREEEEQLGKIIAEGGENAQEARNRLVEANLRLVIHQAKRFLGSGLPIDELNSLGVFGLIRAAEKYDYTMGYKFSTYAIWWIRQAISRGVDDQKNPVHIPVHVRTTLSKVRRARRELEQQYHREPTEEEIAAYLKLPCHKVKTALKSVFSVVYMDKAVGEEEDCCYGDFIADERVGDHCDGLIRQGFEEAIWQVLNTLDEKERFVLVHRFGIGLDEPMSLEKIGKMPEMGVSRERVRQIQDRALCKIRRSPAAMRLLTPYLDMAS
ncbi:MAG: RNA polymerase sigma factor RpoD/SigA [Lachnospiraceae bacterium]|nr:RNA polymerase sigma factor RpoD/SigA [Lachnospiraceae bacterium]